MMKRVTLVLLAILSKSHGTTYKASDQTDALENALKPEFGGFTSDLAGVILEIVRFDLTEASERKKEAKNNYNQAFRKHLEMLQDVQKVYIEKEHKKVKKIFNEAWEEYAKARKNYQSIFFKYEKKRPIVKDWKALGLYLKAKDDCNRAWDKIKEAKKFNKEEAEKAHEKAKKKFIQREKNLKAKYTEHEKSKNFPDCPVYKKDLQDFDLLDESNRECNVKSV